MCIGRSVSHFFPSCKQGQCLPFVLNYLLRDVCTENNLGIQRSCLPPEQSAVMDIFQYNKDNVSLCSQRQACLLPIIKDSDFLSSELFPCDITHCVCVCVCVCVSVCVCVCVCVWWGGGVT